MSAETLRRAASLMRERADCFHQGRWYITPGPAGWSVIRNEWRDEDDEGDEFVFQMDTTSTAEHIASWHPAVALAVADLLAHAATHQVAFTPNVRPLLLAVARAYLGESA